MATLLLEQWHAANDYPSGNFRARCSMAASAAAIAIGSEASATVNHVNRVTLAKAVGSDPSRWLYPFAQTLASIGLDDSSSDAAINTGVATVWNTLAGVL